MKGCKSHADRMGIPVGVSGETVRGVLISEANRTSSFYQETDVASLKCLQTTKHYTYRRNGVSATVFGLHQPDGTAMYALYADHTHPRMAEAAKWQELMQ